MSCPLTVIHVLSYPVSDSIYRSRIPEMHDLHRYFTLIYYTYTHKDCKNADRKWEKLHSSQ